jgi:hypothetical protein
MPGWKTFFVVAAVFNFAVGLPLLIMPEVMASMLGIPVPVDPLFHRLAGLLIGCFGVVYWFLAQDSARYRPLVWLGVAGKGGVVVLFTLAWLAGSVPFLAYAVALGDLAFGVGFLIFLFSTEARAS